MAKRKAKNIARIKISACYIVKNGEKDLLRSLESLSAHVDEIVVVDTGSTDGTVAVAKKFGAKILHMPWQDDFSAARNFALDNATGDWIVFLDADEFFVDNTAKNLRDVIKMARQANMHGVTVNLLNVDKDKNFEVINGTYVLRMFEHAENIRYVGKIHEDVFCDGEPLPRANAPAEMLTLHHTGYSKTVVRSKVERNLKLLLEELETSDKPERTYAYLVDCYYALDDWSNAEKFARLDLSARKNPSSRPIRILIEILQKDSSRADECFELTKTAVARYPLVPEFSAQLAEQLAQRNDFRSAVAEMNRALEKSQNYGEQFESSNFDADKVALARRLIDEWEIKIPLTPDERHEKIAALTDELIRYRELFHDKEKILRTAEKIFALQPDEAAPVEKVASIYIDCELADESEKVMAYLEEKFPPSPYALLLRARLLLIHKNLPACIETAERALTLDGASLVTDMLIHNLLGQAYRFVGVASKTLEHYEFNAKRDISVEKNPSQFARARQIQIEEYSNFLFNLHNLPVNREKLFAEACGFNKFFAQVARYKHKPKRRRHKKIRVAYISPDIRFHVVAFFSMHFFTSYDRTRFEVYVYANNAADHVTNDFRANVDGFRDILDMPPAKVAEQIFRDEIDILVDLAGHTANNSLAVLAYKPAPIQISGIGYFDTTGLDAVDYFIADKFTDPTGLNENFFTEKILRLPHSHFCYTWHDFPFMVTPAPCVKKGFVMFGSFNGFTKVTDEMLTLWKRILDAVPNSRLLLKGRCFRENCDDYARQKLRDAGFDLTRVDCEPDEIDYVGSYEHVDIALDTFPYPGGGTTCDALYMGVPVITLVGERHNSRFGYSLLMNIGLDELCAFSPDDYVQKAVDLANDLPRLREYHLTIRRKMELSPVMDDTIYMAELELAYEQIFNAWINRQPLPNFEQEPPLTVELAKNFYRRTMDYIPLENSIGESKFKSRFDFKRTLYFAKLAARNESVCDATLFLTIADRSFLTDDLIGAYEFMHKAIDCLEQGNRSNFFVAECYSKLAKYSNDTGRHLEALENYQKAFDICDKPARTLDYYDAILLGLHFLDVSNEQMAAFHFDYQKLLDDVDPFKTYHSRHDRIRVAYISGDFRQHAAFAVVFGFMSCHDRSRFEIFCYSKNNTDDKYTELYRQAVEHFIDVKNLNAAQLAKKIHDDEIDIAFDLAGHTGKNSLPTLAYRPAPVQICGIGYMSTTGSKTIDFFVTDEVLDPPGKHEQFFSEKLLYMPAQFSYAQRQDVPTPVGAPCIKNGFVTFGTICRYSKINDEMLAVWKEILDRVTDAKLLMRAQSFISNRLVDVLYQRMKNIGFDMERVIFRPAVHDYFKAISQVDIMLDAYPYVGGATTLDALYMGVPVINFYGERHSTRFGKSILESVGLGDLAVDTAVDYIARAVALANDTETLDLLHKNLRTMFLNSDKLDPVNYCRQLERKFEELAADVL